MEKLKVIFIIVVGGLVLVALFQSFIAANKGETEEQRYSLIRRYNDFEIRFYPSANLATISSNAKSYSDLSGPGFRKLAGYIFGGNEENKNIAMTAPVQMNINDTASSMSFVMPSNYSLADLPKPNDQSVRISKTVEEYIAVITFDGYASDKEIKLYSKKLESLLQANSIKHKGNFRFYGYDPPYKAINRRNEIVVTVDWSEK